MMTLNIQGGDGGSGVVCMRERERLYIWYIRGFTLYLLEFLKRISVALLFKIIRL